MYRLNIEQILNIEKTNLIKILALGQPSIKFIKRIKYFLINKRMLNNKIDVL